MNFDVLNSLRSERIVGMRLHPYVEIGYESVELHCASGRIITIQSSELENSRFDAYSIEVQEAQRAAAVEGTLAASRYVTVQLQVEHIEIFRRDEWEEVAPPAYPTVGQDPVSITTGPVGSAPAGADFTTVVCGAALRCITEPHSSLLVFLNDFPGLVGIAKGEAEIGAYRSVTSSESL